MKMAGVLIVATFILLLASCGRRRGEEYTPPIDLTTQDCVADIFYVPYLSLCDYTDIVFSTEEVQDYTLTTGLTAEHFLYDIEYMLYVLENNFALFDVAYWARGADITAITDNIRAYILANPNMDVDEFYKTLLHSFFPLSGVGHFMIIPPFYHHHIVNSITWHNRVFTRNALTRLRYPHVLAFYEPRSDVGLGIDELFAYGIRLSIIHETLVLLNEADLSENITQAFASGNVSEASELVSRALGIYHNIPTIVTDIIEEGRIAYLAINNFTRHAGSVADVLFFLQDVQQYEHLIIDLRLNTGGSPLQFYESVMSPIIAEDLVVEGFTFLISGGAYTQEFIQNLYGRHFIHSSISNIRSVDSEVRPIYEFLEEFNLSEFYMADVQRLGYGFRIQDTIPARPHSMFNYQPAFDGKIWLLTGPLMYSGAQIASWVVKESGFATLVGETTGGAMGGPRTFVALPNSGILFQMDVFYVTDSHGRPLEAGTIPHYFNREGMDALETVLAMIREAL